MAAGTWTFPNGARTRLLNGTFDLDSDSFKMALLLSASNIGPATTTYAGVTGEHAPVNGYTTGGVAVTLSLSGTTTGSPSTRPMPCGPHRAVLSWRTTPSSTRSAGMCCATVCWNPLGQAT